MWIKLQRSLFKKFILLSICFSIVLSSQPAFGCIREKIADLSLQKNYTIPDQIKKKDIEIAGIKLLVDIGNNSILIYERWIARWYEKLAYYRSMGYKKKAEETEAKIEDAEETIKRVKEQITAYEIKIQDLLDEIKDLYKRIGEIEAEIEKLEEKLPALNQQIAAKKREISKLKTRISAKETELRRRREAEGDSCCPGLVAEIERLRDEKTRKETELADLEEEHGC